MRTQIILTFVGFLSAIWIDGVAAQTAPASPSSLSAGSAPPRVGTQSTVTNTFGTNQLTVAPAVQQMLLQMQADTEQLLPAIGALNNSAHAEAIAVTQPPPSDGSGAILSSRVSANYSGRAGVNLSQNVSRRAGDGGPAVEPPPSPVVAASVPPAVGAPPSPTGVDDPYHGYSGGPESLRYQLVVLQVELERLLPTLASINNQIHLNGGVLTNQIGNAEGFDALGRRLVNPLTNQSVSPLSNRFSRPFTNSAQPSRF